MNIDIISTIIYYYHYQNHTQRKRVKNTVISSFSSHLVVLTFQGVSPYAFFARNDQSTDSLYERKVQEKRNSFKEKANNQKLLRYFLFLHVFLFDLLTQAFLCLAQLQLQSRFFFMFYCFTAFLTVIAVNINRVGMHAFVNGQAQHDY